MKIKSIYIDGLHNAVDKTYNFGDIVYIFGNNGVGKSTILQAIQFALLGYIPGTAKNSREAFLRHSPKQRIEVKLSLSDDVEDVLIQRIVTSKENIISIIPEGYDISPIVKDIELPIFNFNEFVGQTANKLKEYFIKNILPTADGSLDWKTILSESILECNFQDRGKVLEYGMSLIEERVLQDASASVLDQVVTANTVFKSEQSYNKVELQRLQNAVDSLIYYDDYVGPTNLEELTSKLVALGAQRDQLIKYESAVNTIQAQKAEIDNLNARLEHLGGKEEYDAANTKLVVLKESLGRYTDTISKLKLQLATMQTSDSVTESIINSKGICPFTKESCKPITSRIDELRNESASKKAEKVELTKQIEQLLAERNNIETQIRQLESTITDFNNIWGHIETLQKVIGDIPQKPNTDKTIIDLNRDIDALTQSKTKLAANIKYNETIETITTAKYEAELAGKALAAWVKKTDTNGLQTTLMVKPFEELANTMTTYIQKMYGREDIKAHFNISTKANSFSFGLIRNGTYIPYDLLSSGEKCLYTLALMICITNSNKSPLRLLLCDDIFDHLDSIAIENTFKSLKEIKDIQFIFAGVKDCQVADDIMLRLT